jgi:hypothetical protein
MLEQIAYQGRRVQEERQRVYTIGTLESLSASALYTGDSGSSGGFSHIDLPGMSLSAHCHEGENGTAHFKTFNGVKLPMLTSYEYAMGDLYAKNLGLNTNYDKNK